MNPKLPKGKGMWIWKVTHAESGNAQAIADQAKAAGLGHVLFKVGQAGYRYNVSSDLAALTIALHKAGIEAWGWHYVTGENPAAEAQVATERVRTLGLDGYVIDAEAEYKLLSRRKAAAKEFMFRLRLGLDRIPIGLSSYRYPPLHTELPWKEFLEGADFAIPQVYWMQATNAGEQLRMTLERYKNLFTALGFTRPLVATGAAFREHGWQAEPSQVIEFLQVAKAEGLPAVNFWEWWFAREPLPRLWEAIAGFAWEQQEQPPEPPPPNLTTEQRLKRLELMHNL